MMGMSYLVGRQEITLSKDVLSNFSHFNQTE